jgi:hypothetical protein
MPADQHESHEPENVTDLPNSPSGQVERDIILNPANHLDHARKQFCNQIGSDKAPSPYFGDPLRQGDTDRLVLPLTHRSGSDIC